MTFTEAQARFSVIAAGITPACTPSKLVQAQKDLQALTDAMLDDPDRLGECAPVRQAIRALSPRLAGQVTQEVIKDLASRSQALESASALLAATADKAAADARVLTFESPRLIAAGLIGCIGAVNDLRKELEDGGGVLDRERISLVAGKAEALLVQLTQLQGTIKAV
jgi:hypothetical protein